MNMNIFKHSTGTESPRHLIFNIVSTGVEHYNNNKVPSLDRPGHIRKNILKIHFKDSVTSSSTRVATLVSHECGTKSILWFPFEVFSSLEIPKR
jgi:hypothetical protein